MKIKFINTLLLAAILTGTTGCEKWLDVSPVTQVRERQLLETEQGFKDAVTGVYIHLSGANLYGQNLTMGFLDAMGQRYSTSSTSHTFYRTSRYEYNDASTKPYIANIWSGLYTGIANIDNVLLQIDSKQSLFQGNNYNIIKGEALALRALMHFDLLRLFGASPAVDGNRKSIAYVTSFGNEVYPLLTVNAVMDSCLKDLAAAEQLLKVDKSVRNINNDDLFLSYTRNHLNYWAVKGLQARIYLYRNDKPAALAAALEVINNGSSLFPFVTASEASRTTNRDKAYANELIFSLCAFKIEDYVKAYFKTSTTGGSPLLFQTTANINTLYETASGGSSDIRYNYLFTAFPAGFVSTKYYQDDFVQNNESVEYLTKLIPMIRLSEMYYIAAECAPNSVDGVNYLNVVRNKRGLSLLSTGIATLDAEILKEYKKETYAEGQLFYYFKRKNTARVDGSTINMNDATWILPLPENEIEFGKRF